MAIALVIRPAIFDGVISRVNFLFEHEFVAHEINHGLDFVFVQQAIKTMHGCIRLTVFYYLNHAFSTQSSRIGSGEVSGRRVDKARGQGFGVTRITVAKIASIVVYRSPLGMGVTAVCGCFSLNR